MSKTLAKRSCGLLRGAVILLAGGLLVGPSIALADDDGPLFSGLVGLEFGFDRQDTGLPGAHSDTAFSYGGEGRFSVPLGDSGLTFQGDLESLHSEQGASNSPSGASTLGLHLSYRTPQFLVGAFGAFAQTTHNDNDDHGSEGSLVGVEGQAYVGDLLTLYGQVGWADHKLDDSGFRDGWFANLEKRWFFGPDCGLTTGFGYAASGNARFNGNDMEVWTWQAGAFTRITDAYPIYATASYIGAQYDLDTSGAEDLESHRLGLGFQVLFGAESALENDRRGSTLSTPIATTFAAGYAQRF